MEKEIKNKRALFVPDYRSSNPYQELLADGCRKNGIDVFFLEKNIVGFFLLSRTVVKQKIDVLHLHWIHYFFGKKNDLIKSILFLCDIIICKYILKKKVFWTVHNLYSHEANYSKLENFVRRKMAKIAQNIFCHSLEAKRIIAEEYNIDEKKIVNIQHGSYVGYYKNNILRGQARERLEIDEKKFVYLFHGQIRGYKGVEQLIDAFLKCNKKDGILLIAGKTKDPDFRCEIEERSKKNKNIRIHLEYIEDDNLQVFYNAADVVVLPFQKILMSGSLILALSFFKPVISPRGNKTILEYIPKSNFLYNEEKDNLGLVMNYAYEQREKLTEIERENREYIKTLSWDGAGEILNRYYI